MSEAKTDDTVKIHYTGKLDDGTVFDSSEKRDPIEFKIGEGNVIPGFENGIVGMVVGDKKTIKIVADEAYGPRHEGWPRQFDRNQLPKDYDPIVGNFVQIQGPEGEALQMMISEATDENITLDNHPLAGETLNFEVELIAIV